MAKAEAQQQLSLLFQFLHLHALYVPSESTFAPPVLPPVVANATGSDVAAVRMLFDAFSNGPLMGGDDGALERLVKVFEAREEEVLPGTGVTYNRVRELIHGLTAPPEDVRAAPESNDALANESVEDLVAQSNEPAGKADSVVALVDGAAEAVHPPAPQPAAPAQPAFSFMQPSEVDNNGPQAVATPPADEKVQHWAHDIALEAQAPPPSGPSTPAPDASFGGSPATSVPTTPTSVAAAPITSNGLAHMPEPQQQQQPQPPTLDWSAEDDGDGALPHLDELAPAVPVVSLPAPSSTAAQAGTPAGSSDGFQPARQNRRGGGGGGGGPPRGGRGGRGGFRGGRGGRGGAGPNGEGRSESFQRENRGEGQGQEGQQQQRAPRPPRLEHRGESGSGEGKPPGGSFRGRGGRGGGRGGRGGRGGANGAAQGGAAAGGQASPSPAT